MNSSFQPRPHLPPLHFVQVGHTECWFCPASPDVEYNIFRQSLGFNITARVRKPSGEWQVEPLLAPTIHLKAFQSAVSLCESNFVLRHSDPPPAARVDRD